MRKRAQDEFLFAFAFALIVGLFMAVVIWNTATASGKSADGLRVFEPIEFAAVDSSAKTGSGPGYVPSIGRKQAGPDIVASDSLSELVEKTSNQASAQTQTQLPPLELTTQPPTSRIDVPWSYNIPMPGNVGSSSRSSSGAPALVGLIGGYYPTGRSIPKASAEQASIAEDTPHAVPQSSSRQHLTVADSAPAESSTAAPVSSTNVSAGVAAPAVESHGSGPSISTLSSPLAATLDNLVPPATVFEDGSWPARDLSAVTFEDTSIPVESALAQPDPITQLVENYGDPLVVLAQPDLGIEPAPLTVTATEPPRVVNPEPATLLLLGTGLGLVARQLRRRGRSAPGLA